MEICRYLKLKEEKIAAILPCEQRFPYYICTEIYYNIIGPSRGTKPPCWDVKVALEQDKQKKFPFKIMYAFCWSCPSAALTSQHGGFVPRKWQAAKGLFDKHNRPEARF